MRQSRTFWVVAGLVVVLGLVGWGMRPAATVAQPAGGNAPAGVPKYTVVETEGVSLLVVDNSKNVLYFYTCDQGKEAGDALKLRGSIDLNQVGQPTITPKGEPKGDK